MSSLDLLKEIIGLCAGGLLLTSGMPVLIEAYRNDHASTRAERLSRLTMALGNALWVVAGLIGNLWSVVIMCGLNAAIQAAIWVRMKRSQID